MRCTFLLLAVILFAGCLHMTGAPISFTAPTPQTTADAYSCALRKVNELGYTITNANKDAGFITADKITSSVAEQLFTSSQLNDRLTVSIFDAADGKGRTIRATSAKTQVSTAASNIPPRPIRPSGEGMADAQGLLLACGSGPVVRQDSESE